MSNNASLVKEKIEGTICKLLEAIDKMDAQKDALVVVDTCRSVEVLCRGRKHLENQDSML